MKHFLTLMAFLVIGMVSLAQETTGVTLTKEQMDKLGPEAKSQIEALQVEQKVTGTAETAGKWIGLGKEVGIAFNETAKSLALTASEFAKTDLGKFTMFLIAYKIIGTDIIQLVVGILWLIIVLVVSFILYRNNSERTVLVSKKWVGEGKGWQKEYKLLDEDTDYKNFAIGIFCVGIIITIAIIFI